MRKLIHALIVAAIVACVVGPFAAAGPGLGIAKDSTLSGTGSNGDRLGVSISCGAGSAVKSVAGGVVTCVATGGGGTGTVTSITAGTGLAASPSSPITTTGTLSVNVAGGTCSAGNVASALSSTGTLTCTAIGTQGGVTGTGTINNLSKFTSSTAVGDSAVTDNGTTVTVPARMFATTYTGTGQTASRTAADFRNSGSFNATSGALNATVIAATSSSTRSAGANNVTNTALYGTASGAQVNRALWTDAGDVVINQTGGVFNAHGASTFDSTLGVTGLLTLGAGGITGLPTTSCSAGSAVTAFGTTGTGTCSAVGTVTSSTLTANTIAKGTGASAIGNSLLTDDATTLSYNAGKLTVDSATGNTAVAGTLGVTGAATFSSSVTATSGTTTVADFRGTQTSQTNGTGTVNNVAIGTNVTTVLWTCGAPTTITGIANGATSRHLKIIVVSGACAFVNNSGSSSAGNRFGLPRSIDWSGGVGDVIDLEYDGTATVWRANQDTFVPALSVTQTLTAGGVANSDSFTTTNSGAAQTSNTSAATVTTSGSWNTTAAVRTSFAVKATNTAARSAGANNLTNIALYGAATTGQLNYALWTDQGDVNLNAISGSTTINGAATFNSTAAHNVTLANSWSINSTNSSTANTSSKGGILSTVSGTFDTTASALTDYAVFGTSTATRSAGANALTNVGLYGNASGGQTNYALYTDAGDTLIGATSGNATIQGTVSLGDTTHDVGVQRDLGFKRHVLNNGTALTTAALSGCGTSPSISGSDAAFTVTIGTSPGTCQITYLVAYATTPTCFVGAQNGTGKAYSYDATKVSITAPTAGALYDVICIGH